MSCASLGAIKTCNTSAVKPWYLPVSWLKPVWADLCHVFTFKHFPSLCLKPARGKLTLSLLKGALSSVVSTLSSHVTVCFQCKIIQGQKSPTPCKDLLKTGRCSALRVVGLGVCHSLCCCWGEIRVLHISCAWETHCSTGAKLGLCSRWDEWWRGAGVL